MNANIKTANRIPRTLSTAMLLMCVCAFPAPLPTNRSDLKE